VLLGGIPLRETEDELRCRREGVGWTDPECDVSLGSRRAFEVAEEAVDATEAEWARRAESSRVKRFTAASCSFSSSRCISAGVMGRGWRMGTPEASTLGMRPLPLMLGLSGGKAWACMVFGSVPPGEASGSGGGDIGYIWDARREAGVEFCRELWRDNEPEGLLVTFGRGDAGTELRSGAIVCEKSCLLVLRCPKKSLESWSNCCVILVDPAHVYW
jgi:hypothetical protein